MSQNTAFYAGGQVFETWKDWSYPTATYWLPSSASDYTSHPTLNEPLQAGAAYFNTVALELRVYTGSAWVADLDQDKMIDGEWTFSAMPKVNNGSGPYDIIPSGGTPGQILAKADSQNYNTQWQDPPSGTFDPAFNYVITGSWQFAATLRLVNNIALQGRNAADDANKILSYVSPTDIATFGDPSVDAQFRSLAKTELITGGVPVAETTTRANGSMIVYDRSDVPKKAGFRNPTLISVSASTPSSQDWEDRVVDVTAAGVTITLDALEQYTTFRIRNGGNGYTLAQGTANIFVLQGGTFLQGTRTIAPYSSVEVYYTFASEVDLVGNGIS